MNQNPVTVDHPDRSRTLDILCNRFYWPGMRRHVEEYVKNCHACQRLKPRHEFKAPLGDIMELTRPWKVVAVDIREPFPTIPNENHYKLARENGRKSHAASKRHDPVKWQATKQEKTRRNARPKRRQSKEQEDQESSSGLILIRVPQVENPRPELRNPVRNRLALDTPTTVPTFTKHTRTNSQIKRH